jgi:hypothetical protein
MSHRIACYTLFDITRTGVLNRARPGDDIENITDWYHKRNTQCNFDTILQVISLRAQPENITEPKFVTIYDYKFGSEYNISQCWTFDFEVQHDSVFENGIIDLGYLYTDCENVPMILVSNEPSNMPARLDISKELSNIYFVKY